MTLEQGALLNNRYRIIAVLGQGGMGAVYHAVDDNLGVDVAVKENLYLSDEYSRQFKSEATILASLRHPNLPRVGDHFTIPGQGQYLVMDYIAGEDLRERMERCGSLAEAEAVQIGAAVCDALDYLHTRTSPIIHRDIKPGNIKITPEGQILLVDFGLAKITHPAQDTATGARAMTPGYSPPEQYGTAHTDARSDVYSLAATLYSAVSGVIPEDGLGRATGSVELTPLRTRCSQVSRRFAAVIEKGLAIQPHDRYQTAVDFKTALLESQTAGPDAPEEAAAAPSQMELTRGIIEGEVISVPSAGSLARRLPPSYTTPVQPWHTGGNWLALVLLTLLLGSGAWMLFNPDPSAQELSGTIPPLATNTPPPNPTQPCSGDGCYALSNLVYPNTPTSVASPTPTATVTPTPSPTFTPSPTPVGGGAGEIAFVSDRTGLPQVWIMSASGSDQRQVTNHPDGACQPAWSPDGTRLVFTSPCPGKRDSYEHSSLYIIDRDGKNLTALPASPEGDFDPAWSPDGERIAFTSIHNGQPKIYIMNLSDLSVAPFAPSPYSDKHPAWSPDGTQIAFVRSRTAFQIWVGSDNGQAEFQFTRSGDINDQWPSWSPDGEVIYFSQNPILRPIPWLMGMRYEDRGTSREFRISPVVYPGLGSISHANPSPDGSWMVFESWPDGQNHDIYRITNGGADLQRLTSDPGADFDPVWRPGS